MHPHSPSPAPTATSSVGRPFALCFTGADVTSVRNEFPDCRPVALTPDARAALAGADDVLTSRVGLTDCGHARVVGWMRRVEAAARRAGGSGPSLPPVVLDTIIDRLVDLTKVGGRLWHTVFRGPFAAGPWLVRADGRWRRFDAQQRAAAFQLLIDQVPIFESERKSFAAPPLPWAFRWLRDRVAALASLRSRWVVSPRAKLVFKLDDHLKEGKTPVRVVRAMVPKGWREYPRLLRSAWALMRDPPPVLNLPVVGDGRERSLRGAVAAIAASVPVAVLKPIVESKIDGLSRVAELIEQHAGDAARMMRRLKSEFFITYQSTTLVARIAVAAAAQVGLHRLMYNYNSHTVTHGAIAQTANERHYRFKVVDPSYDIFACWSPSAAALTRKLLDKRTALVLPVQSLPSVAPVAGGERPRVLHAGSFLGWGLGFLPWIIETSDEYCDSILALDRAVATLPGVELVVRAKKKSECAPEHLSKLLPRRSGLTITDTKTPYHVAVQEADLLVSFMSTTIEEALMLRRPVLLWGGTPRYRHLPARTAPPAPGDRAPVYAVDDESQLAPMIAAILATHRGRPLGDEEIAPFVWPPDVPGVKELAGAIADGDALLPWHPQRSALSIKRLQQTRRPKAAHQRNGKFQ